MTHGLDKYRSRRNRMRVRALFLRDWDPIGIGEVPECWDEYDAYVNEAYVMVMDRGASVEAVAAFLLDVERRQMELLPGKPDRVRRVAEALVAWRPEFEMESNEPF